MPNLTGVRPDQVGDVFDVAMGYPDPATGIVDMVGYVVSNQGQFQESTNLQDEQHLVQIASPSSSDRFGRYPQVSQGDWSGGERQLIFVNANQYYSSSQVDTSKAGHLKILGAYTKVTLPHAPVTASARAAAADGLNAYVCQNTLSEITQINLISLAVSEVATSASPFTIIRGGDAMYFLTNSGVWQLTDAGAVVQVTNQFANSDSLAYFDGSVWYALGSGTLYTLYSATYPLPGAAPGTLAQTLPQMEKQIISVTNSSSGLVLVTGDTTAGPFSYVYSFDGTTATFIGAVDGFVIDSTEVNGTVYLLASSGVGSTTTVQPLPIIYTVVGSTISVFDDYRQVATAFQPNQLITSSFNGHVASDGIYLYLFWPGLATKRYLLRTSVPYDCGAAGFGDTTTSIAHYGTPTIQGGFLEALSGDAHVWVLQPLVAPNVNGTLTTSWFDFDVPSVRKAFSSIEFTMNSNVDPTALSVQYQTDVLPGFQPLTVTTSIGGDKLIAYLPRDTIGSRIQFQITLLWDAAQGSPDIADYTISGKLTRVWQIGVACRRQQATRAHGTEDTTTAMQKLANIQNCYDLAAGNCILYIPDPTIDQTALDNGRGVALGVSMVGAVLQDYQRSTAPGVAPGYKQAVDGGAQDMEADVTLILSGSLAPL